MEGYVRAEHHINSVESFWHLFKISIASTHVDISRKHFDKYYFPLETPRAGERDV